MSLSSVYKIIFKSIKSSLLFFSVAACLVLALPFFSEAILQKVFAGTLTQASLTISDSRAGATGVDYRFEFRVADTTPIEFISFQFCNSPSLSPCDAPSGLDLTGTEDTGTGITLPGIIVQSNINAGTHPFVHVDVGTPTTPSVNTDYGITFTDITNKSTPSSSSFYVNVRTYADNARSTLIDSVWVASAVLESDSIAVTANIGATFTFTVAGVPTADSSPIAEVAGLVNQTPITVSTTANEIPFGSLGVGTTTAAAHDLTVVTNASNGYIVTVKHLGTVPLIDGSNEIDTFTLGTNTTPVSWQPPDSINTANNGSGYFGYTTEDEVLTTGVAPARFNNNLWAGLNTTPEEIMGAASSTATTGDSERVGWQIAINSQQPAGNYTGTVILVATPTY